MAKVVIDGARTQGITVSVRVDPSLVPLRFWCMYCELIELHATVRRGEQVTVECPTCGGQHTALS